MDNLVVAFLTCGRKEYLDETIASWETLSDISQRKKIILDDSADPEYRSIISSQYPDYEVISLAEENLGYMKAYNYAFKYLYKTDYEFILWVEEDQKLLVEIDISDMVRILKSNKLIQLSTIRKPFFYDELNYKSVIDYLVDLGWPLVQHDGFITHSSMWGNPPSVFKRSILEAHYPDSGEEITVETRFGNKLLSLFPGQTFGFYGKMDDEPQSEHIGKITRTSINYYWGEDE